MQVVLGSSASGGYGRVSLGGVADRLLHSSEVPVALAPRGFVARAGTRVRRVTVAFGRSDGDSDLLRTAAGVADRIGATLRVACFAVRPVNVFSGAVPDGADALVAEEWRRLLDHDIARALDGGALATRVETVVGQGDSWSGRARRRRVGRGRRAGHRHLELGDQPVLPRLARLEDRPQLARPGGADPPLRPAPPHPAPALSPGSPATAGRTPGSRAARPAGA